MLNWERSETKIDVCMYTVYKKDEYGYNMYNMYRVFGIKYIKENLYIKKGEYTDVCVKNRYSSIEHYTIVCITEYFTVTRFRCKKYTLRASRK